jgi:hypothetical protein
MKTKTVSATKVIDSPADLIYKIIADYRNEHSRILPKQYFQSLEVEEGGVGEGTIIRFQMRIPGKTQSFRALITEPEPGCILLETDLNSNTSTTFTIMSLGNENKAKVTIMSMLKNRGFIEGFLAQLFLKNIYRQELELLAIAAEKHTDLIQVNPANTVDPVATK